LSSIIRAFKEKKLVRQAVNLTLRAAKFAADVALLAWDQVLRAAPHAKKMAARTGKFAADLVLLAWDQVLRAAPHVKRLALRAAPPAKNLALQARGNLVLPARNLVILLVLVVLCAGLAQTSPGHTVLSDMGLYEPPVSYTELTLAEPGDLPSALPSPDSPVNVSFDIHNVSGAARHYQWSVVLAKNGQNGRQEGSGAVTAPAQGRVTVTRTVRATCTGGRLQVLVRLVSPAESVDFWVTCPAPVQGSR
jgi:hypothetical protein